jgi:hypothetical protein
LAETDICPLTTGTDNIIITANNATVIGTGNGVGATFTPGDTINGGAFTGNSFDLSDVSALAIGSWGVTNNPGATVSGIQTANILDNGAQAIQGNFTATGPEGDWAGLTNLNVVSHGNSGNVDVLTVDATTAVVVTDTLLFSTFADLTVTGGSTVAITEANGGNFNFGITVNGGLGTTDVSVTQTQNPGSGNDAAVLINDVNGLSLTAAGTITTVTLDGLDGLFAGPSVITDNALTNLTVFDVDALNGATVDITNNLTAPGTPTLDLSLNHDGSLLAPLVINDTFNEIATLNLSEGNSASFLTFNDDGLTNVTLAGGAGAGTGILTATFNDAVASAVTFDFSATTVNGDSFTVNRTLSIAGDSYSLGNAGTVANPEVLTINGGAADVAETINFGSGFKNITDQAHLLGAHSYVNTANTGASYTLFSNITNAVFGSNDTLTFTGSPITKTVADLGTVSANVTSDINAALAATTTGQAVSVNDGTNTYVVAHGDTTGTLTAADSVVEFAAVVGAVTAATVTHNLIHLA